MKIYLTSLICKFISQSLYIHRRRMFIDISCNKIYTTSRISFCISNFIFVRGYWVESSSRIHTDASAMTQWRKCENFLRCNAFPEAWSVFMLGKGGIRLHRRSTKVTNKSIRLEKCRIETAARVNDIAQCRFRVVSKYLANLPAQTRI